MEVVRASLDRFEGDYAVIYSDDGIKFDVPKDLASMKAGSRVLLYVKDGAVVRVTADKKATGDAFERVKKKYDRLKKREHLR